MNRADESEVDFSPGEMGASSEPGRSNWVFWVFLVLLVVRGAQTAWAVSGIWQTETLPRLQDIRPGEKHAAVDKIAGAQTAAMARASLAVVFMAALVAMTIPLMRGKDYALVWIVIIVLVELTIWLIWWAIIRITPAFTHCLLPPYSRALGLVDVFAIVIPADALQAVWNAAVLLLCDVFTRSPKVSV